MGNAARDAEMIEAAVLGVVRVRARRDQCGAIFEAAEPRRSARRCVTNTARDDRGTK